MKEIKRESKNERCGTKDRDRERQGEIEGGGGVHGAGTVLAAINWSVKSN